MGDNAFGRQNFRRNFSSFLQQSSSGSSSSGSITPSTSIPYRQLTSSHNLLTPSMAAAKEKKKTKWPPSGNRNTCLINP
jgi:hypothetical protein